ncbi:MAG: site-2 protease family protein [Gemmatimonadales bacterium]|nr:site-2 protease family protein [Gemmatimonadales bacterium]
MDTLADGLIYYVVFLFSTTVHEAAHAWAALRGGDDTAYLGGQVSLDPVPHIRREPFGMVLLPLLSVAVSGWPIGYASAPFDPRWALRFPRRAAWMALAGPAANAVLVLLAAGVLRYGLSAGVLQAPEVIRFGHLAETRAEGIWPGVVFMLGSLFSMNLLLATFNLLPFPPLDGSGALPLLLGERLGRRWQAFVWGNPVLALVGMIIAWNVFGRLFQPIFIVALRLVHGGVGYH